MKRLSNFIHELQSLKWLNDCTLQELHKIFHNDVVDLNDTIVNLIDKYCANGGIVGYELQDQLQHDFTDVGNDTTKVDSAMVKVPDTDLIYTIDVWKADNADAYILCIKGETTIYVFGKTMKSLKESLELDQQIQEGANSELNKYIQDCLNECIRTGKSFDDVVDEGLFTGLLGGIAGATVGASIMKAICKVLGIDERGVLGGLLTSRTVMGAMGANLGYRI